MTNGAKRRRVPPPPPIVIDVRALTNFAFNAGLTADDAQRILVQAPDWRYPEMLCGETLGDGVRCDMQPHVVVDDAWEGRTMLYCTSCGTVDLWV